MSDMTHVSHFIDAAEKLGVHVQYDFENSGRGVATWKLLSGTSEQKENVMQLFEGNRSDKVVFAYKGIHVGNRWNGTPWF